MLEEAFGIIREIEGRGRTAVVVGGAVRDTLLGRPLTDVDLATDMPLTELSSLFNTHAVGRSVQFDTVVITRGGHAFQISRFRGEGQQQLPHTVAAHTDAGTDPLAEDTAHRDFTINALCMRPDGGVIDHQGGLADLRGRVVRCVGSPDERFSEDPARMLRAVRFAACLDFTIDDETAEAVVRGGPRLATVAGERIGNEILKMAAQSGAVLARGISLMERYGLLELLLPEVANIRELPQPPEWHPEGDAWEHTLAALRSSKSPDPAVNLAVLLHDAGKRPTHRLVAGRHRYHGHDRAGAEIAANVTRRLHAPQRLCAAVIFAVEHHLQAGRCAQLRRSTKLALVASPHWPVLRAVALCDQAARGDGEALDRLDDTLRAAETDAAQQREILTRTPMISGYRIMALTGLGPGPLVGRILNNVRAWAMDNRVDDENLIEAEVLREAQAAAAHESGPESLMDMPAQPCED